MSSVQVAFTIASTDAEGPGLRFALWTQGCTLACPGCCNPELWPTTGGSSRSIASLLDELDAAPEVEGVSLLGGEPYEQHIPLAAFAAGVQERGKTVMVYSGYTWEEIQALDSPLTEHTDLLVAGRYIAEQRTTKRRWIGSENQTLHALTGAYRLDDPRFAEPNHAEIRLNSRGELTVVGFPFDSIMKAFPKKMGHFDV